MLEGVCDGGLIHYEEPAWIIPGTLGAASALLSACQPLRNAPSCLLGAAGADGERTGRPDRTRGPTS
jgi:hypothetical protein